MQLRSRLALIVVPVFLVLPASPASAGGYCHEGGNTQDDTNQVAMKNNCFGPTVAHVDVGEKVTWTNLDGENHIVLGVGGSWNTDEIAPGDSGSMRFDEPGTYPYWCHIHLGMVGAVVVGDGLPSGGASGQASSGPVATAAQDQADVAAVGDQPAERAPEAVDAEPAASTGIDWASLVIAVVLIASLGAFVLARTRTSTPAPKET